MGKVHIIWRLVLVFVRILIFFKIKTGRKLTFDLFFSMYEVLFFPSC